MITLIDADIPKLRKKYKSAKPFPHLQIKNFLKEKQLIKVFQALLKEKFTEKQSDLFKFLQTHDFASTENKTLRELRSFLCSEEFISIINQITDLSLKPGVIDLHGTCYRDTDFLLCHEDKLEGRKVAFMLYLSDFKAADGGALELYSKKLNPVKKYIPKTNTFLFFEISKKTFHQVTEVLKDKQRITIAGWFHA